VDRQKPVSRYADMGKAGMIPGSPDNSMSPGLVNGRREEFGSIGRMMEHWEEMEKREEEEGDRPSNQKESTRRRSSRKMQEVMDKFEEGAGGGTEKCESSNLDKLTGDSTLNPKPKLNSSPQMSRPNYKLKFQNWKSCHKNNRYVTKQKPIDIITKSADCDWLQPLAKMKPGVESGVKRKVEEMDNKISKHRVWRGPGYKN
jgi:hypothetical protein